VHNYKATPNFSGHEFGKCSALIFRQTWHVALCEMGILLLLARKWLIVSSKWYLHTCLEGLKKGCVMTVFLKPRFELGAFQIKVTHFAISDTCLTQKFIYYYVVLEVLC
jgi:hypothetical protein